MFAFTHLYSLPRGSVSLHGSPSFPLYHVGLWGGPSCPRGSWSPPVCQQRLLPATGSDEQGCLWWEVSRGTPCIDSQFAPADLISVVFYLIYFTFEQLQFFRFSGCNFCSLVLSHARIPHIELAAICRDCEVYHFEYMLALWFLFLAAGLRAVWCPPQWQRLVVLWQGTQLWVKIMLLLACTTYLTNMWTLLVYKLFLIFHQLRWCWTSTVVSLNQLFLSPCRFSSTVTVCQWWQASPCLLLIGWFSVHHDAVPVSTLREGHPERPRGSCYRLCLVPQQWHHCINISWWNAAYLEHGGWAMHSRGQGPRIQRAALLHFPAHE